MASCWGQENSISEYLESENSVPKNSFMKKLVLNIMEAL